MVLLSQELINIRIRENELLNDINDGSSLKTQAAKKFTEQYLAQMDVHKFFWPAKKYMDVNGRDLYRSHAERIHMAFSQAKSCMFAWGFTIMILSLTCLSCIIFVVETVPATQVYPSEFCADNCKPVSGSNRKNEILLDLRASKADLCEECEPHAHPTFVVVETICMSIFIIEYTVRVCTAYSVGTDPPSKWRWLNRTVKFVLRPLNLVDLISIMPFVILQFQSDAQGGNLAIVRILRLMRVLKLFRDGKLATGLELFAAVIRASSLVFFLTGILVLFMVIVLATLMFYAEKGTWDPEDGFYKRQSLHPDLPDQISPYTSIPMTFWWVVVTFCTVGYGDLTPTTGSGLFIGVVTMYVGIVFLAMPITVIGANFANIFTRAQTVEALLASEQVRQEKLMRRVAMFAGWGEDEDRILQQKLRECWNVWRQEAWTVSNDDSDPVRTDWELDRLKWLDYSDDDRDDMCISLRHMQSLARVLIETDTQNPPPNGDEGQTIPLQLQRTRPSSNSPVATSKPVLSSDPNSPWTPSQSAPDTTMSRAAAVEAICDLQPPDLERIEHGLVCLQHLISHLNLESLQQQQ